MKTEADSDDNTAVGVGVDIKTEVDSDDNITDGVGVDIKTEADYLDNTECPHDDQPSVGMSGFSDSLYLCSFPVLVEWIPSLITVVLF